MELPRRETRNLRKGRVSIPGATYFLTLCTHNRAPVLNDERLAETVIGTIRQSETAGDFKLEAATVMPDHVHILARAGKTIPLERIVAKLKSATRRSTEYAFRWQSNFFDHRVRAGQDLEPFVFYIFMNPYNRGLVDCDVFWRWFISRPEANWRFMEVWNDGCPRPEWLQKSGTAQDLVEETLRHSRPQSS